MHTNHCRDFIEKGGVEKLMKIYTLSSLPYDFALATSSYSLSHLFRTIGETNSSAIVPSASKEMVPAFEKCRTLMDYGGSDSLFKQYVSIKSDQVEFLAKSNELYNALITIHGLTGLWSDLYCSQTFSTSRAVGPIIQSLSSDDGINILKEMNRLHRTCVWEHHTFKRSIPKVWLHVKSKKDKDEKKDDGSKDEKKEPELFADPNDVRVLNARHLQFLVAKIPSVLIPLLSGIARMLLPKRSPELRKQVARITEVFSDMLIENLAWKRSNEPGTEVIRHHYYSVLYGQMKILFFDGK